MMTKVREDQFDSDLEDELRQEFGAESESFNFDESCSRHWMCPFCGAFMREEKEHCSNCHEPRF